MEVIAQHRASLYPESVTIDLDSSRRVYETLKLAGVLKADADLAGLHDTSIVKG